MFNFLGGFFFVLDEHAVGYGVIFVEYSIFP